MSGVSRLSTETAATTTSRWRSRLARGSSGRAYGRPTSTTIPAGAYGKIPRHNVFVARMQYALPGVPLLVARVATVSGNTLLPS